MIRRALILACVGLVGCGDAPLQDTPTRALPSVRIADSALPPIKTFAATVPIAPARSNANIAADFLDLHFQLESGRMLDRFTRFEAPITLRVSGTPPASLMPDLRHLLARLRSEAGIDIALSTQSDANITLNVINRSDIRRALPQAACFVAPNVTSIADFRRARHQPRTDWGQLAQRDKLGIFVPADVSPQELRDCLHEELAQGLGPLNDLYRLPDSAFNDDNIHTVLTGFDMLILRVGYAPELRSGMGRAEVAARLPAILSRLNPRGDALPFVPVAATPRNWIDSIETALGPGSAATVRRNAAALATRTAQQMGWRDHRAAFSLYVQGRMVAADDPAAAQPYFNAALAMLGQGPETALHRAHIVTQTAAYLVATGNGTGALSQTAPARAAAARAENAALLTTLMLLEAEALDLTGQRVQADALRLDSLGWARYGFGSDWAVRTRMRDIAALGPARNRGT